MRCVLSVLSSRSDLFAKHQLNQSGSHRPNLRKILYVIRSGPAPPAIWCHIAAAAGRARRGERQARRLWPCCSIPADSAEPFAADDAREARRVLLAHRMVEIECALDGATANVPNLLRLPLSGP